MEKATDELHPYKGRHNVNPTTTAKERIIVSQTKYDDVIVACNNCKKDFPVTETWLNNTHGVVCTDCYIGFADEATYIPGGMEAEVLYGIERASGKS